MMTCRNVLDAECLKRQNRSWGIDICESILW